MPAEQDQVALGAGAGAATQRVRRPLDRGASGRRSSRIVGRLTWKSKNSSGSTRATTCGVERLPRPPRAPSSRRWRRRSSPRTRRRARVIGAKEAHPPTSTDPLCDPTANGAPGRPVRRIRIGGVEAAAKVNPVPDAGAVTGIAAGRLAAAGPAVRRALRLRAQGPADRPQRLQLPRGRAARPQRHDPGARLPRRRPDRRPLRARRRDPGPRPGRAFQGVAGRRDRVDERSSSPEASTQPSSCPPPIARSRSWRGSSSTWRGKSTTRLSRRWSSGCCSRAEQAAEFRRAPCSRGGHHAYLGGLLEHTVAVGTLVTRGLPAPPAARLRPADGGGAAP